MVLVSGSDSVLNSTLTVVLCIAAVAKAHGYYSICGKVELIQNLCDGFILWKTPEFFLMCHYTLANLNAWTSLLFHILVPGKSTTAEVCRNSQFIRFTRDLKLKLWTYREPLEWRLEWT